MLIDDKAEILPGINNRLSFLFFIFYLRSLYHLFLFFMPSVCLAVPDLQAFTPGAHVLPQQQVVECDRTDDVKLLLDHLFNEVWVHPMLTHGGVEEAKTLQEDLHCNSPLFWETGAPLPQACWFGP